MKRKCRKKLVNKLVEECIKNVDEVKITKISENKHKSSSCTPHIVLFSIVFTINIGIGTYFVYSHWYLKNDDARVLLNTHTETAIY